MQLSQTGSLEHVEHPAPHATQVADAGDATVTSL